MKASFLPDLVIEMRDYKNSAIEFCRRIIMRELQ